MATRLPLFPLGTVLLPGLVLPLHVFEPRYRVLVQALLELPDGAPRQFGVVAIKLGPGGRRATACRRCTRSAAPPSCARWRPYDDGRFDIVTVGDVRGSGWPGSTAGASRTTPAWSTSSTRGRRRRRRPHVALLAEHVALRFAAYGEDRR